MAFRLNFYFFAIRTYTKLHETDGMGLYALSLKLAFSFFFFFAVDLVPQNFHCCVHSDSLSPFIICFLYLYFFYFRTFVFIYIFISFTYLHILIYCTLSVLKPFFKYFLFALNFLFDFCFNLLY